MGMGKWDLAKELRLGGHPVPSGTSGTYRKSHNPLPLGQEAASCRPFSGFWILTCWVRFPLWEEGTKAAVRLIPQQ